MKCKIEVELPGNKLIKLMPQFGDAVEIMATSIIFELTTRSKTSRRGTAMCVGCKFSNKDAKAVLGEIKGIEDAFLLDGETMTLKPDYR